MPNNTIKRKISTINYLSAELIDSRCPLRIKALKECLIKHREELDILYQELKEM